MYIAIDSSNKLSYTGVLSGKDNEIFDLHSKIEKIFRENGISPNFHWCKLSRRAKDKVKNKIATVFFESGINLTIFEHNRPKEIEKKKYYIGYIPNQISYSLENWLRGRGGNIEIEVDDDYNIHGLPNGTRHFIESFLNSISYRLINKIATVLRNHKLKITIKQINGNILTLYASVAPKGSKVIGLVDILMGCYLYDRKLFEDKRKKVEKPRLYYRKI